MQAPSFIERGSHMFTDDKQCFNRLAAHGKLTKVNHSERYSDGEACTNWAESYFARLPRSEMGVHHHFAGTYLLNYANEISWREGNWAIASPTRDISPSTDASADADHEVNTIHLGWSGRFRRRHSPLFRSRRCGAQWPSRLGEFWKVCRWDSGSAAELRSTHISEFFDLRIYVDRGGRLLDAIKPFHAYLGSMVLPTVQFCDMHLKACPSERQKP